MAAPQLTFFCELHTPELSTVLTDELLEDLAAMGARVSLGLLDFSAERAEAVRRLNAASVPVVAWLLLPDEQGYWFNQQNGSQAAARYVEFRNWTAETACTGMASAWTSNRTSPKCANCAAAGGDCFPSGWGGR